jgi:hypothetical protein
LEAKFYRPYFEIIDNKIKLISGYRSKVKLTITIEYLSPLYWLEDEIESDADWYWNSLRKEKRL